MNLIKSKIKNVILFKILFILSIFTNSYASTMDFTDHNSPYLTYKYFESESHKTPPTLNFYANKKFDGKPFIVINKDGLTIGDKLVCTWFDTYSSRTDLRALKAVEPKTVEEESCAKNGPIISMYELFIIEVKDNHSDKFYEVKYNDISLFLNKKETGDFEFHESKNVQIEKESRRSEDNYQELLKTDLALKNFIQKMQACIKNKDEKCLPTTNANEPLILRWHDFVCSYHNNLKVVPKKTFCLDWFQNRCFSSKALKQTGECEEMLKSKQGPLPHENKAVEKSISNFLWKSLETCFPKEINKNPQIKVFKYSRNTEIKIKTNEPFDLECQITSHTDSETNSIVWKLSGLKANKKKSAETEEDFNIFGP